MGSTTTRLTCTLTVGVTCILPYGIIAASLVLHLQYESDHVLFTFARKLTDLSSLADYRIVPFAPLSSMPLYEFLRTWSGVSGMTTALAHHLIDEGAPASAPPQLSWLRIASELNQQENELKKNMYAPYQRTKQKTAISTFSKLACRETTF